MRLHHRPTSRDGFTLVELLVAMALIIFLMTILSVAFSVAMGTFSELKAIGDMNSQLRSTSTLVRRDLASDHFERASGDPARLNSIPTTSAWDGANKGFFYIRQDSAGVPEGADADGIVAVRADGSPITAGRGTHEFGMTIRLSARTQSDTVSGSTTLPILGNLGGNNLLDFAYNPQQLVTQWAEVYYFLRPTPVLTSEANATNLTLYTLYRRQRILTPNSMILPNTGPNAVAFNPDVINSSSLGLAQVPLGPMPVQPPQFIAVGPESLTTFVTPPPAPGVFIPLNRLGGWHDPFRTGYPGPYPSPPPHTGPGPAPATFDWRPYSITGTDAANYGSDVVLNNVLSFRIQVLYGAGTSFQDLPGTTWPRIYDTARPPSGANPQIRAMRIQLRVYNAKSNMTRQVSIIQDL